MADVINTDTLEMRMSVNEGGAPYTSAPWQVITREQYNLWSIIPIQYRKWVNDHVEEMSQPEKDAVDAAQLAARLDEVVQQLDQVGDILRGFAKVLVTELNNHADLSNGIKSAIDNGANIGAIKTAVGALSPLPTRTLTQLRSAIRAELED